MQVPVAVNVRPISIAYFIDIEDVERFTDVALLACTQWGGIHSLIIPVGSDGIFPWFFQALQSHPPDLVVDACDEHSLLLADILSQYPSDLPRQIWGDFAVNDDTAHAARFYENANSDDATAEVSLFQLPILQIYDPEPWQDAFGRACIVAAFGGIYPGQEDYYSTHFVLSPANITVPNVPFLDHQLRQEPLTSPINLTKTLLTTHYVQAAGIQAHFDVVLATMVPELCWYWTKRGVDDASLVRTRTRRTLILPASMFGDAAARRHLFDLIRRELAAASPGLISGRDINFVTWQRSNRRPRTTIRQCAQRGELVPMPKDAPLTTTMHSGRVEGEWPAARHRGDSPLTFTLDAFEHPPGPYLEGIDFTPPKPVDLQVGPNALVIPPHPPLGGVFERVALNAESDLWDRYPQSAALARSISPNARFTFKSLTTLGPAPPYESQWVLTVPSDLEAVRLYFSERGYEATVSPAGRKAQILINLMGGLRGCDALRDHAYFSLVQTLAVPRAKKVAQDLVAMIEERWGIPKTRDMAAFIEDVRAALVDVDAIPSRSRTCSTLSQLRQALRPVKGGRILEILDDLVCKRVVFRGVEVRCTECDERTWFALGTLQDFIVCPGCFTEQPVSVRSGDEERPWEYRLNAAVNTALDQDVMAPILLLAKLVCERADVYCAFPGIDLRSTGNGDTAGDFDVLYVLQGRVYAGECKAGSHLADKDFRLARLAFDLGCAGFHFASLFGFDDQSLLQIQELLAELSHRGFRVFTHGPDELLRPG